MTGKATYSNPLSIAYTAAKQRQAEGEWDVLALVAAGFLALTEAGYTITPPPVAEAATDA
jgi:hypothetical protein